MFYLYIGSAIISYLITKSSMENVENSLKKADLSISKTEYEENKKRICLLIIACIPFINIINAIRSFFYKDDLYDLYKEAQCELIIEDNEDLLNKYEKACLSRNKTKRRTIEKQISKANSLMNLGFDKTEAFEKVFN